MSAPVALLSIALVILCGSALCSSIEAAVLTVNPVQVHTLARQNVGGARALERIKNRPGPTLALLVVLNNLFNIGGSLVLGDRIGDAFRGQPDRETLVIGFSALFTLLVILLGEILPKSLGSHLASPLALISARPLLLLDRLAKPLLLLLERLMPSLRAEAELTTNEREIHLLAKLGSQQGQIEADEAAMIGKVFALNDLTARDLMVSRVATPSLAGAAPLEQQRQRILSSADQWWVVLGEEVDQVLGVLSRESALAALVRGSGALAVRDLCEPPQYVPEMMRADRLLTSFRRGDQASVRVVVDEHGALVGLVSADAILGVLAGWKRVAIESDSDSDYSLKR